ncbi:MAG: acyl-CoA/acyl-ACP dehydrogenase, partial [Deltaproteobacteria bacterium]|nr:acyl-CoA/acyl-ACP dehydrogenase [Deltaproteobacteria bacterium]
LARYSIGAAAIALGLCRGSLDEAVAYAKTRRQGGREIIGWSEVRMLLGDIATQHTFATLAFEHARDAVDARASGWQRSATALAIRLQELACELSSSSLQVLGGAGYTTEFKQEARFRDAFHTQHVLGSHPVRKLRAGSSER